MPAMNSVRRARKAGDPLNPAGTARVGPQENNFLEGRSLVIVKRARVAAAVFLTAVTILATTGSGASADNEDDMTLHVRLTGYQEDPLTLSTTGSGTFRMQINEDT